MKTERYNWDLRKAIVSKGYTYETLGKAIGLPIYRLCRIVTGDAKVKPEERRDIAKILKMPQKNLFINRDQKK